MRLRVLFVLLIALLPASSAGAWPWPAFPGTLPGFPPPPPPPPSTPPVSVVDANNQPVGTVVAVWPGFVNVVLPVEGRHLVLSMYKTAVEGGSAIHYTELGCTGESLMEQPSLTPVPSLTPLIQLSPVTGPELTVWVPTDPQEEAALRSVKSILRRDGGDAKHTPRTHRT